MANVYVKGTRLTVRQALRQLPSVLAGRAPDPTGLAIGVNLAVGMELLSIIKEAFIAKARGGADEAGESWKPLSPKTIAYSRRHPGSAGKGGKRPLLTASQDKKWQQVYGTMLRRFQKQGQSDAGRHAAAYAWVVVKSMGGKTKIGVYGQTKVEILRDTGQLFNSLSPGMAHANQILKAVPGSVTVGTNRKGAAGHHEGIPGRLPQRRLWPHPSRWPSSWWNRLLGVTRQSMLLVAQRFMGG